MHPGPSGAWQAIRACVRTVYSLRPKPRTLVFFFAAAVLSMSVIGPVRIDLGVSLLAACAPAYLPACALGVVAGSLAGGGLPAASCAAAAAVLCVRVLISGKRQTPAVYAAAAGSCAAAGIVPLFEADFSAVSVLILACRIAGTAGGIALFRAALIRKTGPARTGALCALLPGLAAICLPGGWSAAAFALAWAACAGAGPVYACAGCAVLSALSPQMAFCFVSACLCALVFRLIRPGTVPACAAACAVYILKGFLAGSIGFAICAAAGTVAALVLPPDRFLPAPAPAKLPGSPARQELRQAAQAMRLAADMLHTPDEDPRRELSVILDAAETRICPSCARFRSCQCSEELLSGMAGSAAGILARGSVTPAELPAQLRSRCIHPDALLTAVNDALDEERAGRRIRRRLREVQLASHAQYAFMAGMLERLSERMYAPGCQVNYTPEISVRASGRGGSSVSGDRGAAFQGPCATYYVLLCDGMGSGEAAAAESRQAVELLRSLLLSGADARSALRALNGIYLLRDDGCFSTVDLLRINLTTGDAILYKWGASASYLKRSRGLRLLGCGGLPPGLEPDGTSEQIHLNLDHGDVLVLLSDGLAGKETKRRLEHCGSLDPGDVARSLFAGREPGTDDCTAVCVRLKRSVQREPAAIS